MKDLDEPGWEPLSETVLQDQLGAYDAMRARCGVAYSERWGWSVFRHADVLRVLHDHEAFSNVVSAHRSVPSGMDPPEHTAYRRVLQPYFEPDRMRRFELTCRALARSSLTVAAASGTFDAMQDFAIPFAVRCQCAFLGWPDNLVEPLREWTRRSQVAVLAADGAALSELARQFRAHVDEVLATRRAGTANGDDVTSSLMRARVGGVPLTDEELTSIFRNWTVGEIGSLAASIGIVTHELAVNEASYRKLRAAPESLPAALEEILRVTGPLVMNRRVATRDVEICGKRIAAGQPVSVVWVAANRDPEVFDAPEEVRLGRQQGPNLLYGAGIHVCPGAPLARLELQVAIEAMHFQGPRRVTLAGGDARRAAYPTNGWASLPVRFE